MTKPSTSTSLAVGVSKRESHDASGFCGASGFSVGKSVEQMFG